MPLIFAAGWAQVYATTRNGVTALMVAAENGRASTARTFLDAGADSDLQDAGGRTALGVAEKLCPHEIVAMLRGARQRPRWEGSDGDPAWWRTDEPKRMGHLAEPARMGKKNLDPAG